MKRKEILEIEKRTEDNLYEMHFFYEEGWWRAYEMSAYLCNHLGDNLEETERLKPTKKMLNNVGEYIFVGMKLSSFSKYLPDINIDSQGCKIDENHMVFDVKEFYNSVDMTELTDKFIQWKTSISLKPTNSNKNSTKTKDNEYVIDSIISNSTLFSIVQKLLSYPIYDKTPNENTQFINTLKKELVSIII